MLATHLSSSSSRLLDIIHIMTAEQSLELAMQHFQAGRLGETEMLCRQVLAANAGNADALHLLGLVAFQAKRPEIALDLLRRAAALSPGSSEVYANLGMVLTVLGNLPEAIASYRRSLELNPHNPQAWANLGNALQMQGHINDSIAMYHKALAIRPDYSEAINDLGNSLRGAGRLDEAIAQYRRALALRPHFPQCHNNLAVSLLETDQLQAAEDECRLALAQSADYPEAFANLGNVLMARGQMKEAIAAFRKAISLNPKMPEPLTNMGNAMLQVGEIDAAIEAFNQSAAVGPNSAAPYCNLSNAMEVKGQYEQSIQYARKAIAIQPDCAEAYNNLGNAYRQLYRFDEALAAFNQAVAIRPGYAEAHNNLGGVMVASGRPREAIAKFRHAAASKPSYLEAMVNVGMVQLVLGEFHEGWKQYENRRQNPSIFRPHITGPMWDGSNLAGKRILLHSEQGIGDTLQFVRYIPMVRARGGKIILEVQGLVHPLLQSFEGIEQCIVRNDPLPAYDVQCSLLSLPYIFDTNLQTIPAKVPYVFPDPRRVEQWRARVAAPRKFKVGIVWAGRSDYKNDLNRSMRLELLRPLTGIAGTSFYSMQKGNASEQALNPPPGMKLMDCSLELNNFADTAALVANLDLVISVDTAVAHLAGAMAIPVWTMLPFAPDWRWLMDRGDSPWYPTMRLFRQNKPGDWSQPIEQMTDALLKLARGNQNPGDAFRKSQPMRRATAQDRPAAALHPESAPWHNNQAVSLMERGELDAAEAHGRKALELNPDYPQALTNLGNILTAKGRYREAIEFCRRAVALMPKMIEAHINLGNALLKNGQVDDAIEVFRQSVAAAPGQAAAHCNLAHALEMNGLFEQAIDSARAAIAIQPDCLEAFNNLGNAYRQLYRFDEAATALHQAIALRPDCAEAHNNLGGVLVASGRPREAIPKFRQALGLRADYFQASENLATVQLLVGDLSAGWKQYEKRLESPVAIRSHIQQSRWDGSDLAGRRILLHCEQGIGDTLQFIRYIPMVRARGGNIILECQAPVYPLLKSLDGVDQCIILNDAPPPFDVQCSLLSLPHIFNTDLETIPANLPYIFPDAKRVDHWRQRLGGQRQHGNHMFPLSPSPGIPGEGWGGGRTPMGGRNPLPGPVAGGRQFRSLTPEYQGRGTEEPHLNMHLPRPLQLKIGLVWAGGTEYRNDRNRSMALSVLAPLIEIPGTFFVSLQKGKTAGQLLNLPAGMPLIDWTKELKDFAETAALIANLDLVISVDTAVAHLAGAMGKPVWTMLPFAPDWRWLLDRDDSPWYPTMRLFRQHKPGDWSQPIEQITQALRKLVKEKGEG
jgi:Flp pilus assembly protein TadD